MPGVDCLTSGLDWLVHGINCLIPDCDSRARLGLECLTFGVDCLASGLDCLTHGLDRVIPGRACLTWWHVRAIALLLLARNILYLELTVLYLILTVVCMASTVLCLAMTF